jgi:iron complex transport system substrate-binding protein
MGLKFWIWPVLLVGCLVISGCAATSAYSTSSALTGTAATSAAVNSSPTAAATPTVTPVAPGPSGNPAAINFPYTFSDDAGRRVTLPALPRRIVSLSPSNTEIVYALGLGDELVGNTQYCNYPEAALAVTKVGGFSDVDIERVVSVQPDLILASNIHEEKVLPSLAQLGIPIMVIHPITLKGINADITLLGQITGQAQKAAELTANLQTRVEAIKTQTAQTTGDKPRILYVTWHDPLYSAGDNTITGELIKIAGGVNIAAELNGYATMTLEQVVERNPQIIVVMSSMGSNTSIEYINSESRLQVTEALKKKQVVQVDSDLFGRTTPRIVDALEQLAALIRQGK